MPEKGQAARSNACGSSGDVLRNGRAGVEDDGTARMCSSLEESGVRARPGPSRMGGTLPRGDRSVLRPCLK